MKHKIKTFLWAVLLCLMLEISVAFLPEPFWGCYGRRRVLLERGWLGVFSVCETESVYVCVPCRAPLSSCTAQLSSAQLGREERRTQARAHGRWSAHKPNRPRADPLDLPAAGRRLREHREPSEHREGPRPDSRSCQPGNGDCRCARAHVWQSLRWRRCPVRFRQPGLLC